MSAPVPAWLPPLRAAAAEDFRRKPGRPAGPEVALQLRRRLPPAPPAGEQAA